MAQGGLLPLVLLGGGAAALALYLGTKSSSSSAAPKAAEPVDPGPRPLPVGATPEQAALCENYGAMLDGFWQAVSAGDAPRALICGPMLEVARGAWQALQKTGCLRPGEIDPGEWCAKSPFEIGEGEEPTQDDWCYSEEAGAAREAIYDWYDARAPDWCDPWVLGPAQAGWAALGAHGCDRSGPKMLNPSEWCVPDGAAISGCIGCGPMVGAMTPAQVEIQRAALERALQEL
jgi:hypothetical protein